jgi:hypothetical protein
MGVGLKGIHLEGTEHCRMNGSAEKAETFTGESFQA